MAAAWCDHVPRQQQQEKASRAALCKPCPGPHPSTPSPPHLLASMSRISDVSRQSSSSWPSSARCCAALRPPASLSRRKATAAAAVCYARGQQRQSSSSSRSVGVSRGLVAVANGWIDTGAAAATSRTQHLQQQRTHSNTRSSMHAAPQRPLNSLTLWADQAVLLLQQHPAAQHLGPRADAGVQRRRPAPEHARRALHSGHVLQQHLRGEATTRQSTCIGCRVQAPASCWCCCCTPACSGSSTQHAQPRSASTSSAP